HRPAEGGAEPLALSDREQLVAAVGPQDPAVAAAELALAQAVAQPLPEQAAVVVVGYEADLHALGLLGDAQPRFGGEAPDLGLLAVPDGEHHAGQFALPEREQHVGLVLTLVQPLQEGRPVPAALDARVVAGGDE